MAWPFSPFSDLVSLLSVFEGNSPPSMLIASTILVSLVSRARAAERTLVSDLDAMVTYCSN